MADLGDIRGGIATRLATISGLRTLDYVEGTIQPPVAVIGFPERIEYDESFARGVDRYVVPIRLYVAGTVNRTTNNALESYLAKSGASSVKAAIEGDRTLGGVVADCVVATMIGAGMFDHGGLDYLAAEWELTVLV